MNENQQKVSSPRSPQSQKKPPQPITPRSDEQYTRIEQYDDMNFLNSLMFEFNLRNDRFRELYDAYSELFMPLEANHIFLIELLKLEKTKQSFLEFGYDSQQMLTYIYWTQNKAIPRVYNQYENIETLVKSFGTYMHEIYRTIYQDDYENLLEEKSEILDIEPFKILKHNFLHPEFIPSEYTEFNLYVHFNALENKDVVQNRMKSLIDDFYDRFHKLDNIYFRNEKTKGVMIHLKDDIDTVKDHVGSNNKQMQFANYFYIYDQKNLGYAEVQIQDSLSSHVYEKFKYEEIDGNTQLGKKVSINTIKKNYKLMEDLIKNQRFKDFYYTIESIVIT